MNVQICYECARKLHLMEAYNEADLGTLDDSSTCFFCVRARPTRELQIKGAIFRSNWTWTSVVLPERSSRGMIGEKLVTERNAASDLYATAMENARIDPTYRSQYLHKAKQASKAFAAARDRHHACMRAHGISPVGKYP